MTNSPVPEMPTTLWLSLASKDNPDDADWYHGNTMPMDGDTRYIRAAPIAEQARELIPRLANAWGDCVSMDEFHQIHADCLALLRTIAGEGKP